VKGISHQGPTDSDSLGRYYTNSEISDFLVSQMVGLNPRSVLDLGAGAGSLSIAALVKWRNIELITVDIDKQVSGILGNGVRKHSSAKHTHICADVLSLSSDELMELRHKKLEVGVCNPPFILPKWRKGYSEIIEDAGFSSCLPVMNTVDSALLFLAQNLRLLTDGATLGIMLPDSLISSAKYKNFRRELLERYSVRLVVKLPRYSFHNTDALAHIVILQKKKPSGSNVELFMLRESHELSQGYSVSFEDAINRLDYEFYKYPIQKSTKKVILLGDLASEITRGSISSSEAKDMHAHVIHTTDLTSKNYGMWCNFSRLGKKIDSERTQYKTASPGDILVARVGRNLETKVIGVSSGYPLISDCILRLRVPKQYREQILQALSCKEGANWLASRAYGVGAKHITKSDLKLFPIKV